LIAELISHGDALDNADDTDVAGISDANRGR